MKNDNNNMKKTIIGNESIEKEMIGFNEDYFKKEYQSEIFNNKIHHKLNDNTIHSKIISRELNYIDYSSENALKFLKVVKY